MKYCNCIYGWRRMRFSVCGPFVDKFFLTIKRKYKLGTNSPQHHAKMSLSSTNGFLQKRTAIERRPKVFSYNILTIP